MTYHRPVRTRLVAVVVVLALAASGIVVAVASTTANGLPRYTNGYAKWPKLNRKPFRSTGPLSNAHVGLKNVFASKPRRRGKFPNGTVIVKTIVPRGAGYVGQVAVMRKANGRWRYVEYTRSSKSERYTILAQGQLCQSCHQQARATDYVFTKR